MIDSLTRWPLLFAFSFAFILGCSSKPERPDPVPQAPVVQPGAERWTDDALLLPADSPLVVSLRFSDLLNGARDLKNWLVAEPAMFGEDGADTVKRFDGYWSVVTGYLGGDPATPSTWSAQGLDVERTTYFGAYGMGDDDRRFVDAVDEVVRDELDLGPDADLVDALQALQRAGETKVGLNARVARAVKGLRSIPGFRILIPSADDSRLIAFVDGLAIGAGYIRLSPEEAHAMKLGPLGRAYYDAESPIPSFSLKARAGYVIMDAVFEPFSAQAVTGQNAPTLRPTVVGHLQRVAAEFVPGRPAAPAPPGHASIGLSIDQAGMADLVKARGYRTLLESLRMVSADKRDAILIDGLTHSLVNSSSWRVRADEITGLTYSAKVGRDQGVVAGFEMALFGAPGTPRLEAGPSSRGLDVENRSLSAAIDIDPFFAEPWRKWLYVENPSRTLDLLDASEADPIFPTLILPRNLALLVGNLAQATPESFNPTLGALLTVFPSVQRLEFAAIDPNLSRIFFQPRFYVLATLRPDATAPERQGAASQIVHFAAGLTRGLRSLPTAKLQLGALPPNTTTTIVSDGLPITYHYAANGEHPLLLVGAGMEVAEVDSELARIGDADHLPPSSVAFARLEPVALISMLTAMDTNALEPIDAGILAQRLGVLRFTVEPDQENEVQRLRFRIALEKPTKL